MIYIGGYLLLDDEEDVDNDSEKDGNEVIKLKFYKVVLKLWLYRNIRCCIYYFG